jgi:hypothetical protein
MHTRCEQPNSNCFALTTGITPITGLRSCCMEKFKLQMIKWRYLVRHRGPKLTLAPQQAPFVSALQTGNESQPIKGGRVCRLRGWCYSSVRKSGKPGRNRLTGNKESGLTNCAPGAGGEGDCPTPAEQAPLILVACGCGFAEILPRFSLFCIVKWLILLTGLRVR